ncbi:MAG: serine hydrolase [Gemmata sp.]
MRRSLLLLALLLAPAPVRAAEFDPKVLDAVVEKALKEFDAPGAAVVVVQDGRVIHLKGFGVRENGKADKVTPDTVFPIASCSKAFTATALAMLADDGKLTWDDKVRDHLDAFRLSDELADRDVTLRDLLCHRTGMPRHDMLWAGLTRDSGELIKRWGKAPAASSFRSRWEYANVPFTAAGVIAGKLDGTDWPGVMKKRIFEPLGMERSSCTKKEGTADPNHATPHYRGLDGALTALAWDDNDHIGGAGAANSTARDLGAWLQFQLAGGKYDGRRLLTERQLRETHTAQILPRLDDPLAIYFPPQVTRVTTYALGWFAHDYRGVTCVSHGGTLTGVRAQCMLVPDKKLGVFVLCNQRPSYVTEAVCKTALDLLLALPAEDWVGFYKAQMARLDFNTAAGQKKREAARKPNTKPSLELKEYAGAFEDRAYGRAEVAFEDGRLLVRWGKFTFRADHYHFDTFTAAPVEPKAAAVSLDRTTFDLQFRLGASGEVEGMRFLDQEFKRAKK